MFEEGEKMLRQSFDDSRKLCAYKLFRHLCAWRVFPTGMAIFTRKQIWLAAFWLKICGRNSGIVRPVRLSVSNHGAKGCTASAVALIRSASVMMEASKSFNFLEVYFQSSVASKAILVSRKSCLIWLNMSVLRRNNMASSLSYLRTRRSQNLVKLQAKQDPYSSTPISVSSSPPPTAAAAATSFCAWNKKLNH